MSEGPCAVHTLWVTLCRVTSVTSERHTAPFMSLTVADANPKLWISCESRAYGGGDNGGYRYWVAATIPPNTSPRPPNRYQFDGAPNRSSIT